MPRPFTFRLEAVLEERVRAERRQQLRVGEVERERLAVEERLRACQAGIERAKEELREQLGGGKAGATGRVAVESVRLQAHASLHMVALAHRTVVELAGVHRRLDLARMDLARATAARKAVSLLRERRHDQWKRSLARQEAAEIDELVVMRFGRKDGLV